MLPFECSLTKINSTFQASSCSAHLVISSQEIDALSSELMQVKLTVPVWKVASILMKIQSSFSACNLSIICVFVFIKPCLFVCLSIWFKSVVYKKLSVMSYCALPCVPFSKKTLKDRCQFTSYLLSYVLDIFASFFVLFLFFFSCLLMFLGW